VVRNVVLAMSVLANCALAYILFQPVNAATVSDRLTCEQARNDSENKKAVSEYAEGHSWSFSKTHEFLRNSDYELRNVSARDGKLTFVYASSAFYPSTCGIHVPGIDGGIVRIDTEVVVDPRVRSVW
jgi:hypothetical protein